MKSRLAVASALFLVIFVGVAAFSSCSIKTRVMNSGQDFAEFWLKQEGLDLDRRALLFETMVVSKYPGVYEETVFKGRKEDRSEIIKSYLAVLGDNDAQGIIEFSRRFNTLANYQVKRFKDNFPHVSIDTDVYGIIALNWFWGKVFPLETRSSNVAFDISRLKDLDDEKLNIIFAHEFAHSIHLPSMGISSVDTLMQGMWTEGFASYVSGKVNGIDEASAVLGRVNAGKCDDLNGVNRKFRAVMYSDLVEKLEQEWLSGNGPVYCLGYNVMRYLSRKYTLNEMLSWKTDELPVYVGEALSGLEKSISGDASD